MIIGFTIYGDSLKDIHSYYENAKIISENKMDCFVCSRYECNDVEKELSVFMEQLNVLPAII